MKYLTMTGFTVRTGSDRWTLGYEGENNSRTLQIKTTDDLTDFATINLLIDTLDCGAMTVETVSNYKVLSMVLTAGMLGESGKKTCQLLMMDSEGTVIKKTNQFYMVVGRSNVIEGTVPDSERIVIITDYIEEKVDEFLGEVGDAVNLHTEEISDLGERVTDLEAGGGGGSGGSSTLAGLTDTKISNKLDGQILVYDGTSNKWMNKTPDFTDGAFIVTISGTGSYRTCDKTYNEIYSALSSGKNVVAVDGTGVVYPYAGVMSQNGLVSIALGISVVYNKIATLTGYLILEMEGSTVAIRQDQTSSFYNTSETYTRNEVNEYVTNRLGNYYTVKQINEKIGNIETLLAAI